MNCKQSNVSPFQNFKPKYPKFKNYTVDTVVGSLESPEKVYERIPPVFFRSPNCGEKFGEYVPILKYKRRYVFFELCCESCHNLIVDSTAFYETAYDLLYLSYFLSLIIQYLLENLTMPPLFA